MTITIGSLAILLSIIGTVGTVVGVLVWYKSKIDDMSHKLDTLCNKVDSDIKARLSALLLINKVNDKLNLYKNKLQVKLTLAVLNLVSKMLQYTLKFFLYSSLIQTMNTKLLKLLSILTTKP